MSEGSRSVGALPGMSLTRFVPSSDARARMVDRFGHVARRFTTDGGTPPESETFKLLADAQRVAIEAQDAADAALEEARALAIDFEQLRNRHDALEADHQRLRQDHDAILSGSGIDGSVLDDLRADVDAGTARVRRVDEALKTLSRRVAESGTVVPQPEQRQPLDGLDAEVGVHNELDRSAVPIRGGSTEDRDAKLTTVLGELRAFGGRRSTRQSR